ncbi:hypothetical protein BP6252_13296 [Coleophoma cylindrospora]|uniref:Zn(2)-C6 fungal-type domain-containing protein n=1 Tax=Coleophoma cylindrospora TaxID=1849047 RepID=A0A3D8QAZ5_9HELO|nr:hypothetical protein BP6252_13296 [Coleophoma cylindrospora]
MTPSHTDQLGSLSLTFCPADLRLQHPPTDIRSPSLRTHATVAPSGMAPHSLACMQCFKSKCKCVARLAGDGCERCHRLKKPCRPSDSVRKSANAQRRQSSAARIGALEGNVEHLVRLLTLVARSPAGLATLDQTAREDDALAGYEQLISHYKQGTADTAAVGGEGIATDSPATSFSSTYARETTADTLADALLGSGPALTQDSETCLATFRDKMLPSFSFTYLSPSITAQQLQHDRPFLMRAIMAVASPCRQQKVVYGRELKEVLAQAMLVQNQSSLDLLQGVLVFTAWSYDQIINPLGTLSRLVSLAISLACDLRLDKPLPSDEHMMKPMVDDAYEQEQNRSKQWFVAEEQRAVLACYVLSSIISIYFAQIDAMKWKPRMHESLRAIEANKESPTDVAFAFQVRLQLLAQEAVQFREQREWDCAGASSDPPPGFLADFYIRTLQTQLHQLGDALPLALQERGTLTMHRHYIELCVNETARSLYSSAHQGLVSGSGGISGHDPVNANGGNTLGFDRLNFSWRSLGAIKAWMETFFSLSPAECAGLSFIHMAQLARCLVVLYRMSTFVHPGWDCNMVRNTLDILSVLDRVSKILELASNEAGEQLPDDQFMHLAGQMRKFRAKAETRMSGNLTTVEDGSWLNSGAMITPGGSKGVTLEDPMLLQPPSTSDDTFLDSIFRDFGEGWSV